MIQSENYILYCVTMEVPKKEGMTLSNELSVSPTLHMHCLNDKFHMQIS